MRAGLLPRDLHTSERPSTTAQWTTLARALELRRPAAQRIVTDAFASVFLTPPYRRLLRALAAGGPVVRLSERHELAGMSTYVLCRHRFIDDHLTAELRDGAEQVVLLGAGYDSRAYRFADLLAGRPVHEVDLAPLSRRKAGIVAANRQLFGPTAIRRVEIDFRVDSLAERLLDAGFSVGARTFVVWEGVSMYLSREAITATLGTLREVCGSGSVLAMDWLDHLAGWRPVDSLRRAGIGSVRLIGEPVTFPASVGQAAALLAGCGFAVTDLADAAEMTRRYATDGRSSDRAVYVLAARL
ncbi:MAG: SAM-dependent methyltransferase [Jatrophihabitans sp.]|nr:MAG: SAM-dependent methyltransferase [Jatrophihabitans sp.]